MDYRAAEGCPDRGAFIHEIQRRSRIAVPVGKAEQPDVVLLVRLERDQKPGARGRLTITQGTKSSERVLSGKTCAEVATAMALVAALAVDPLAELSPAPEPLPLPPDPAGPPILSTQPALVTGPAPLLPSLPPLSPRFAKIPPPSDASLLAWPLPVWPLVPEPPAPVKEEGLRVGGGARFALNAGAAPTAMAGVAGFGELRKDASLGWSVRAELSYLTVTEATSVQGVDSSYRLLRGVARACVPLVRLSWVGLSPCGAFGGGGLWGELSRAGTGSSEEQVEALGPWLEAGVSGRLLAFPTEWLAVEAELGPTFPLVRSFFGNPEGQLHKPFPVTLDLGVGASLAF